MTLSLNNVVGSNCRTRSKKAEGSLILCFEEVCVDLCVSEDDPFVNKWRPRSSPSASRLFGGVWSCGRNRRVSILGVRESRSIEAHTYPLGHLPISSANWSVASMAVPGCEGSTCFVGMPACRFTGLQLCSDCDIMATYVKDEGWFWRTSVEGSPPVNAC